MAAAKAVFFFNFFFKIEGHFFILPLFPYIQITIGLPYVTGLSNIFQFSKYMCNALDAYVSATQTVDIVNHLGSSNTCYHSSSGNFGKQGSAMAIKAISFIHNGICLNILQSCSYFCTGERTEGANLNETYLVTLCSHFIRSEERRVGKECRSRWSPYH